MSTHLVVTNSFGDFQRGDSITDADRVAEILASHNAGNVVAVTAPDEPLAESAAPAA